MLPMRLISSDSHVVEPPHLWEERIEPRFRGKAPRVVERDTGDQWYVEQGTSAGHIGVNLQAGRRFENPDTLTFDAKYSTAPRGAYDPIARLIDQDRDGVSAEVLYPSLAFSFYSVVEDHALLLAIFRSYNDWLAEFVRSAPGRLKGIAVVPVDDVAAAVGELKRCASMGLLGAMIPVVPADPQYDDSSYDLLWAVAQDLGVPLTFHIATSRKRHPLQNLATLSRPEVDGAVGLTNRDVPLRNSLGAMIFGGVFERFPLLKIVCAEYEIAWAPYFVREMDRVYRETAYGKVIRGTLKMLPSEAFARNVFISFQEDEMGLSSYGAVGTDNLMWGSDYPHAEGTFPKSREILQGILAGRSVEEKEKIAGLNTARLYGFSGEALG